MSETLFWTARKRSRRQGGEYVGQLLTDGGWRELMRRLLRDDPLWRRRVRIRLEPRIANEEAPNFDGLLIDWEIDWGPRSDP